MQAKELRDLSDQELAAREDELRETQFRLRLRRGTNQLESPAALRQARRDLARVLTIRAERARGATSGR
jgi:large subunit ribosomal protein L29